VATFSKIAHLRALQVAEPRCCETASGSVRRDTEPVHMLRVLRPKATRISATLRGHIGPLSASTTATPQGANAGLTRSRTPIRCHSLLEHLVKAAPLRRIGIED
jgi:hypothetical protein